MRLSCMIQRSRTEPAFPYSNNKKMNVFIAIQYYMYLHCTLIYAACSHGTTLQGVLNVLLSLTVYAIKKAAHIFFFITSTQRKQTKSQRIAKRACLNLFTHYYYYLPHDFLYTIISGVRSIPTYSMFSQTRYSILSFCH